MSIQNSEVCEDREGRKEFPSMHGGGVKAAAIVCVVEVLENVVFLSNAINFIAYFIKSMHYPPAEAANMVTNFMGTSFLLTIFGGFIGDSFFTKFTTFIAFCLLEILGITLLTVQAQYDRLRPDVDSKPSHPQAAMLFFGLYAIAIGVGGIKSNLPAHGADQVNYGDQRRVSAFFNWFFLSLCTGGLLAATVMVWIQENKGWSVSFKVSLAVLCFALVIFVSGYPVYRFKQPGGSPLRRIYKVFASAIRNRRASIAGIDRAESADANPGKFEFLDKALNDGNIDVNEVYETKTFLGLLPIFASTIMMNCCLAQLQTFTVEQGASMNRKIKNFQIPTQSMSVFPLIIMISSIPLYEYFAESRKNRNSTRSVIYTFFQPLKRIGVGLALASVSMSVAAAIEVKRRGAAQNKEELSVFWLGFQYLLLGVADVFTLGGMLEFFYSEAPDSMRSMSTALSWCSTSMGYFLSSVLVSITNSITGKFGHQWLGGEGLNHCRLDLFYILLCVLNFLNLLNYIYWAKRY